MTRVFQGRRPGRPPSTSEYWTGPGSPYLAYWSTSARLDIWPPGSWVRHGYDTLADWTPNGGPGLLETSSQYTEPGAAEALILAGTLEILPAAAGPEDRGVDWVEVDP